MSRLDELALQLKGLVHVRALLETQGASAEELDAHSDEIARVRAELAGVAAGERGGESLMRARLFTAENRKWWTLVAVSFGLFMIMLDNTVVNVALPSIRDDLGISISELEWVVNAYALTFGVLLLTGGKLADLLGRRRIFIVGLVDLHRRLALVRAGRRRRLADRRAHRPGRRRRADEPGDALDHHRDLPAAAAGDGDRHLGRRLRARPGDRPAGRRGADRADQLELDLLRQHPGRRPRGGGRAGFIDETKDTSREQRLDLPGLVTSAAGLFALTYGLIETNTHAWGSTRVVFLFAVAAVALAVFVVLELRQRMPMLDLSLFRNPTFSGANATMALVGLAMFGVFFFNSIFLQNILGYSAIKTGATFLPMTVLIILVAPAAGRVSDRIGPRWLMGAGMTLLAVSLLLFGTLDEQSSFWNILPGLARRRGRHGDHDGADDLRGDGLGAGRQGRRRLRGDQQHAPGRRLARHRGHGRRSSRPA